MTNTAKGVPRIWFITGATSGIGNALAFAAIERGDNVVALARDTRQLDGLAGTHPDRVLAIDTDVRDEQSVKNAVAQAVTKFGRIDVVANNAGYGLFGAVEESTDAQARAIFDTNVFGVLNVLRATLPVLRRQKSGHILQGSSYYGQSAHPGVGLLAATKYAVEGLTDALVGEVAPLGIKVTAVEPGFTATQFLANLDVACNYASDYDQTVRKVHEDLGALPPEAFNDPDRVATAIIAVVDADNPPTRLATGSAAAKGIRAALDARIADLDAWADVTHSVDAPAAA